MNIWMDFLIALIVFLLIPGIAITRSYVDDYRKEKEKEQGRQKAHRHNSGPAIEKLSHAIVRLQCGEEVTPDEVAGLLAAVSKESGAGEQRDAAEKSTE